MMMWWLKGCWLWLRMLLVVVIERWRQWWCDYWGRRVYVMTKRLLLMNQIIKCWRCSRCCCCCRYSCRRTANATVNSIVVCIKIMKCWIVVMFLKIRLSVWLYNVAFDFKFERIHFISHTSSLSVSAIPKTTGDRLERDVQTKRKNDDD